MWFFITFPISGTLLLALILLGLSTGANITEVLVNILNEHQKLLIILMAFLSVSVTVTSLEKIQSTFKKVICIGINIVLDYIIQLGAVVIIFTEVNAMVEGFENNSVGMVFIFIFGVLELLIMILVGIGGGYGIPFKINEIVAMMEERNIPGIIAIGINVILKIIYGIVFLGLCYMLMKEYYPNAYNNLFQNTIYDTALKTSAEWMESFALVVTKYMP